MIAPTLRVVHRTTARTRLRTRGMKGNSDYFAQLQGALASMSGVRAVEVNPLTESVLVEHDVPIDPLLREAEQRGFLRLDLGPSEEEPYLARIGRALSNSDRKLQDVSSGRVNLDTLAFLGMLAGGVFQVSRGAALPAGVTMLRYALEFVTSASQSELGKRAREGSNGAEVDGAGK